MRNIITPAILLATALALTTTATFAATTTPAPKPAVTIAMAKPVQTAHQQHKQAVRAHENVKNKKAMCRDEFRAERREQGQQDFMKACLARG